MAGRIAYYGNIVRDGLVLNLDAAKVDSYPGSGTMWRDIAGTTITGSLINGPTFDSTNYGSIVFDGVDDYTDLGTQNLIQNDFTLNIWFKLNTTFTKEHFIFSNNYAANPSLLITADTFTTETLLSAYYSGVSGVVQYGLNSSVLPNSQIYNLTLVRSGSTNIPYINNVIQTSRIFTSSIVLGSGRYVLGWAIPRNKSTAYMQGNIYNTQIYNRPLSATEVTQNYNAVKGRYGL